jgi:hypothetical protein
METYWEQPPVIKVYEALGAVADGRIEMTGEYEAKCWSSSGKEYYDVRFGPETRAIMANDNGSYWKGYLGYPSIALLLVLGELPYRDDLAKLLAGIPWKEINTRFKNDFEKTLAHIAGEMRAEDWRELSAYAEELVRELEDKPYLMLGKLVKPPVGDVNQSTPWNALSISNGVLNWMPMWSRSVL